MARPHGTGQIDQLPSGRFRARLRTAAGLIAVGDPFESRAAAHEALEAARAVAGKVAEASKLTVYAYGLRALDERERDGIADVRTERSRWETHVKGTELGGLPLRGLARVDVTDWIRGVSRKRTAKGPLAKQTVQNVLNLLRVVLAMALERELARENVAIGVHVPRRERRIDDPGTYLLPDEQRALLAAAKVPVQRRTVAFALGSGVRQGEQWGLLISDVHAQGSAVRPYPHVIIKRSRDGATKTGRTRPVPLFGIALEAVTEQLAAIRSGEVKSRSGHLWPSARGGMRGTFEPSWWDGLVEAAELTGPGRHDGHPVRWHDLRHTCATSLLCGWWSPRPWTLDQVQALLGHTSRKTTERYAKIAESVLAEVASTTTRLPIHTPHERPTALADATRILRAIPPELLRSHLGDLNPRPAVYENPAFVGNAAVCEAIVALSPHAWGVAAERAIREMAAGRASLAVDVLEVLLGACEGARASSSPEVGGLQVGAG